MGSGISIVNDTPYTWHCKVASDARALKIIVMSVGGFSALLGTIGLSAAFGPLFLKLRPPARINPATFVAPKTFLGMPTAKFLNELKKVEVGATLAAATSPALIVAANVERTLEDGLIKRDFVKLDPGQKNRWYTKLPLELHAGVCIRKYIVDSGVRTETITLRPLFTTLNRKVNTPYFIAKYYGKKKNVLTQDLIAVPETSKNEDQLVDSILKENGVPHSTSISIPAAKTMSNPNLRGGAAVK